MALLIRWLVNTLALFVVAQFVDGITYDSIAALFIASLVLGLLNAIVRPVFFWLTLPITVITLGLFLLVLNGVMLWLTAFVVPGFQIDGFVPAVIGALILAVISLVTNRIGKDEKK